jgi:hypothetical protein
MPTARPTSQWENACSQKYAKSLLAIIGRVPSVPSRPACHASATAPEQPGDLDDVAMYDRDAELGHDALWFGHVTSTVPLVCIAVSRVAQGSYGTLAASSTPRLRLGWSRRVARSVGRVCVCVAVERADASMMRPPIPKV